MDGQDENLYNFERIEEQREIEEQKGIERKRRRQESNKHENISDHEIQYSILFYYLGVVISLVDERMKVAKIIYLNKNQRNKILNYSLIKYVSIISLT